MAKKKANHNLIIEWIEISHETACVQQMPDDNE
jgi:hypothetical protein